MGLMEFLSQIWLECLKYSFSVLGCTKILIWSSFLICWKCISVTLVLCLLILFVWPIFGWPLYLTYLYFQEHQGMHSKILFEQVIEVVHPHNLRYGLILMWCQVYCTRILLGLEHVLNFDVNLVIVHGGQNQNYHLGFVVVDPGGQGQNHLCFEMMDPGGQGQNYLCFEVMDPGRQGQNYLCFEVLDPVGQGQNCIVLRWWTLVVKVRTICFEVVDPGDQGQNYLCIEVVDPGGQGQLFVFWDGGPWWSRSELFVCCRFSNISMEIAFRRYNLLNCSEILDIVSSLWQLWWGQRGSPLRLGTVDI